MRRFVLAATLVALLVADVQAAASIKVTADTFTVDDTARQATFTGNVIVARDLMQLTANEVVVTYGTAGMNDIESFTATGRVTIKTKDQTATGDRAVFVPATQILTLSGDVKVESAVGTLTGPQLVIDLKTNSSVFTGSSKGRVTGVFTPQ